MKKRFLSLVLFAVSVMLLASCTDEKLPPESEAPLSHVHEFGRWSYFKRPDCTSDGIKYRSCECGETEVEQISAYGHRNGAWEVVNPDCVTSGYRTRYCTECDVRVDYEVIGALGHDYTVVDIPASSDTIGCTTYTCKRCGYTYDDNLVAAWGPVHLRYEVLEDGTCKVLGFYGEKENAILPEGSDVTELLIPEKIVGYLADGSAVEYTVSAVGAYAFAGYGMLERILLPDTVKIVEDGAFYGCASLKELRLGSSLTAIGESAFEGCVALTDITLPRTVSVIGDRAFALCSSITEFTLPDNIKAIPQGLFAGCSALEKISFASDLKYIADYAFESCEALVSLPALSSVEAIGRSAFYGCASLLEVSFGEELAFIDVGAFRKADGLVKVSIPSLKDWLEISFADSTSNPLCGNAKLYAQGRVVTALSSTGGVNAIGDYQFYGYDHLTSLDIPSAVTYIGDYAFSGCEALKTVSVSAKLEYIGTGTFSDCKSLTSVALPETVTVIGSRAFAGCSALTSVKNSSAFELIGEYAFADCVELASIDLTSAKEIRDHAFYGCLALETVEFSDELLSIGESAFENCNITGELVLPAALKSIGARAFAGCNGITAVSFPESLVSIGESAFAGCENVARVDAVSLALWCAVDFGDEYSNPLVYASEFYVDGYLLRDLVIDEGIKTVSDFALWKCKSVDTVYFVGEKDDLAALIGRYNAFVYGALVNDSVYYFSATEPQKEGNFWFYNESGNICKW